MSEPQLQPDSQSNVMEPKNMEQNVQQDDINLFPEINQQELLKQQSQSNTPQQNLELQQDEHLISLETSQEKHENLQPLIQIEQSPQHVQSSLQQPQQNHQNETHLVMNSPQQEPQHPNNNSNESQPDDLLIFFDSSKKESPTSSLQTNPQLTEKDQLISLDSPQNNSQPPPQTDSQPKELKESPQKKETQEQQKSEIQHTQSTPKQDLQQPKQNEQQQPQKTEQKSQKQLVEQLFQLVQKQLTQIQQELQQEIKSKPAKQQQQNQQPSNDQPEQKPSFFQRLFNTNKTPSAIYPPNFPPPPIPNKKTLVFDLDETLIHSCEFPPHQKVEAFQSGDPPIYVFKRPGLDNFLKKYTKVFDVFIFTFGEKFYADPIIDVICPSLDEQHRLFRDSCTIENDDVHKDIGAFKRPLSDIILIEDNYHVKHFHPENTIIIPKWAGVPYDKALINWLPKILDKCAKAKDVRKEIAHITYDKWMCVRTE